MLPIKLIEHHLYLSLIHHQHVDTLRTDLCCVCMLVFYLCVSVCVHVVSLCVCMCHVCAYMCHALEKLEVNLTQNGLPQLQFQDLYRLPLLPLTTV